MIDDFKRVRGALYQVKLDLAEAQSWLATAKDALAKGANALPAEVIETQIERRFNLDQEVMTLVSEIKKAEGKVSEAAKVVAGTDDPAIVTAKRKLEGLKSQYNQMWEVKSPAIRDKIAAGAEGFDAGREVHEATILVNKLTARQAVLKADFDSLLALGASHGADSVEITLVQDDRRTLLDMQNAVTRRLEQLRYEAKGDARVRPVNPNGAMIPKKPVSDHRSLVFGLAPLVMLFVSIGLFMGVEAFAGPRVAPAGGKAEGEA